MKLIWNACGNSYLGNPLTDNAARLDTSGVDNSTQVGTPQVGGEGYDGKNGRFKTKATQNVTHFRTFMSGGINRNLTSNRRLLRFF